MSEFRVINLLIEHPQIENDINEAKSRANRTMPLTRDLVLREAISRYCQLLPVKHYKPLSTIGPDQQ